MMKKILLVFALACFCTGAGFSLDAKSVRQSGKTQFSLSVGGHIVRARFIAPVA